MEDLFTTKYDDVIKEQLQHLYNYPEMLPFIGTNYEKMSSKIFILGESHYFDEDVVEELGETFLTDWYNQNSLKLDKWITNYFFTRGNLKLVEDMEYRKPLASYFNIRRELKDKEDLINSDKVFSNFVYFNYFQRPSIISGGSITPNEKDNEVAYDTILNMADVLKPNKIIFASVKGFDSFNYSSTINSSKVLSNSIDVDFVPHASSRWWNVKAGKYGNMTGREKFITLLKSK